MSRKLSYTIVVVATITSLVFAQNTSEHGDPLQVHLISPDLIMQHQKAIHLTDDQRDKIIGEIGLAQMDFNKLNWDLRDLMDQFAEKLSQTQIDEQAALQHFQDVLNTENKIKKAQITLMIRLKNYLTQEQQDTLKTLRISPSLK